MNYPSIPAQREPGALGRATEPSASPKAPAPGVNSHAPKAKGRPVKYPIQLKVNINPAMAASLQRVCSRLGIPEGIGARIAIAQFLTQQEQQYRGNNG